MTITINQRLDNLDDAVTKLAFVLKAIEELSIEKGAMTRAEIQNKIIELSEKGWKPGTGGKNAFDLER